jgi:hypothetical protein
MKYDFLFYKRLIFKTFESNIYLKQYFKNKANFAKKMFFPEPKQVFVP